MQYLLSEDEYNRLKDAPEAVRKERAETLQRVCTLAATRVPVKGYDGEFRPWGCLLDDTYSEEYCCDLCPVSEDCPHPRKRWSK